MKVEKGIIITLLFIMFVALVFVIKTYSQVPMVVPPPPVVAVEPWYDGPFMEKGVSVYFYNGRFYRFDRGHFVYLYPCPPGRLEFYKKHWGNAWERHRLAREPIREPRSKPAPKKEEKK